MQSLLAAKPEKEKTQRAQSRPGTGGGLLHWRRQRRARRLACPCFCAARLEARRPKPARPVQPKLAVNAPGDAFEQEADRVAEQVGSDALVSGVSSLSGPAVQRACACGGSDDDCPACRAASSSASVQRKATQSDAPPEPGEAVSRTLQSPGQPLAPAVRADMEARLGYDFQNVRVHTDPDASRSAQEIHALAYASGTSIAFDAGQYRPDATEGRKLLAHELTHVVQQGGATRRSAAPETPATSHTARNAPASPAPVSRALSRPAIQRDPNHSAAPQRPPHPRPLPLRLIPARSLSR